MNNLPSHLNSKVTTSQELLSIQRPPSVDKNSKMPDQSGDDNLDNVQDIKKLTEEERKKFEELSNSLFESLNTGLAFRFHERSGDWYAIIENKITKEVLKEIPPKYILELRAQLKEMIGIFLDKKI